MDLSKPDTLCVYCGSNLEKVTAEELAKVMTGPLEGVSHHALDFPLHVAKAILKKYEVRRK